MVYLLKMVIFHGYVSHNQMVVSKVHEHLERHISAWSAAHLQQLPTGASYGSFANHYPWKVLFVAGHHWTIGYQDVSKKIRKAKH